MKVNIEATKRKLLKSGRKVAPWAATHDLNPDTARTFLNGRYVPSPGGEFEKKITRALAKDGLLVIRRERKKRMVLPKCSTCTTSLQQTAEAK